MLRGAHADLVRLGIKTAARSSNLVSHHGAQVRRANASIANAAILCSRFSGTCLLALDGFWSRQSLELLGLMLVIFSHFLKGFPGSAAAGGTGPRTVKIRYFK